MKQCSDADHIVDLDMCSEGNKQDIKVKNNWKKKGREKKGRKEGRREGRKGNRKEEKNNQ